MIQVKSDQSEIINGITFKEYIFYILRFDIDELHKPQSVLQYKHLPWYGPSGVKD